jgi:protein associated with RNAse G/E
MPVEQPEKLMIFKYNASMEEVWHYDGRIIERAPNKVTLEAFFDKPDRPFHGVVLATGDRFLETYYSDRWYNILEIRDKTTDALKGWYCNVAYPARFEDGRVSYVDLALDLLVYPDGRQLVLDEDEFEELTLSEDDTCSARDALKQLQLLFAEKKY